MEQRFEKLTPEQICGLIVKYLEIEESGFGNELERRFSRVPVRTFRGTVGPRLPGCGDLQPALFSLSITTCAMSAFFRGFESVLL